MSEWKAVWLVTIKYANSAHGGGYPTRQVKARTATELRRIVEWARANPNVIGFPYQRIRERYGDEPTRCRNGHGYGGGSSTRVRQDWTECVCGGHMAYICGHQGCRDIIIDPPIYDNCDVNPNAVLRRAGRKLPGP